MVFYNDDDFIKRYKFSKGTVMMLADNIGDYLQRKQQKASNLSPVLQVMIALRFYATGSFLKLVGDTFGNHCEQTHGENTLIAYTNSVDLAQSALRIHIV